MAVVEAHEGFLAYAAHELRTPLATQRALLELALADPDANVAAWRETGEGILRACDHQERLLEACLILARSQDGPRRCVPVDLAVIVRDSLRAHDRRSLTTVVTLGTAWTLGDPALIGRLVANLVSNAIRHNSADGGVRVATCSAAGRAVFTIANTGPLIPAAEVSCLFQPFRRLNSSADGVGLGLAIVQAIADAHDATVSAEARLGGGLEIDIAFPALD